MADKDLGSKWDGLNPNLLARIVAVEATGKHTGGNAVVAPITDGNIELTANWQSPFEQSGAETKAPAMMAMLQTGALGDYSQALGEAVTGSKNWLARMFPALGLSGAEEAPQGVPAFIAEAQGRTGMTKLNSTQVFTGAAPVKFTITLLFRAFRDPKTEVRAPIDQLARWMLSQELAQSGSIVSAGRAVAGGKIVSALLPSKAPQMVAFQFGGYRFAPLVIEGLSHQLHVPRGVDGNMLNVSVQLNLASLTALDQEDWARAGRGQPINLFNN